MDAHNKSVNTRVTSMNWQQKYQIPYPLSKLRVGQIATMVVVKSCICIVDTRCKGLDLALHSRSNRVLLLFKASTELVF